MNKLSNIKHQKKWKWITNFNNYKPYLFILNSKYLNNNSYKSLYQTLIYNLPKNKLLINKIYNETRKKNLRMGSCKGKIIDQSSSYYGNKPIWLNNNVKYNKIKLIYLNYVFTKLAKKYNYLGFK